MGAAHRDCCLSRFHWTYLVWRQLLVNWRGSACMIKVTRILDCP